MTMDALISGDIEIGTIVDSNVAFIGYSKSPIKVIASLATKLDDALWYTTNAKITKPTDLIGKRVGYTPATTSHIFLDRFLKANKISWSQITPVVLQPPAMEGALKAGHVDAVSIWQPWGTNIKNSLKESVAHFRNELEIYPSRILLATTDSVIKEKGEVIRRAIFTLSKAEELYKQNPASTFSYLGPEVGAEATQMGHVLERFDFSIYPATSAQNLVEEIGTWINKSQADFKGLDLPSYSNLFVDDFISE